MNLNSAVEDAAETNSVFEDLVDLQNSVVCFVVATVGHVVHMEDHLCHPKFNSNSPTTLYSFSVVLSLYLYTQCVIVNGKSTNSRLNLKGYAEGGGRTQ